MTTCCSCVGCEHCTTSCPNEVRRGRCSKCVHAAIRTTVVEQQDRQRQGDADERADRLAALNTPMRLSAEPKHRD